MRTLSAIAGSAVLILSGSPGPGQQPGPGTDPTVLERPHPLAVAENADPSDLISKLSAKLKSQGFSVAANKKEFFVEARKYFDTQSPKDYDRVILWLARDVKDSSRYINVYFLFGRYEECSGEMARQFTAS